MHNAIGTKVKSALKKVGAKLHFGSKSKSHLALVDPPAKPLDDDMAPHLEIVTGGHLTSDIAQTSVGLPISEANPNHPNISIATSIPIATNVNASADPNTPAEIAQAGPQDRAKVKAVLKATGKALESLVVAGLAALVHVLVENEVSA